MTSVSLGYKTSKAALNMCKPSHISVQCLMHTDQALHWSARVHRHSVHACLWHDMSSTIFLDGHQYVSANSFCTLAIAHWPSIALVCQHISGHDAFGTAAAFWLDSRSGVIDCGQFLLPQEAKL